MFGRTLYQDVRSYTILGRSVLHYSTLLNTEVDYQSLSSLYSKLFSMEIISGKFPGHFRIGIFFFTFKECSSSFMLMAWRKIMHKDIFLLWEHNTFTLVCISQS